MMFCFENNSSESSSKNTCFDAPLPSVATKSPLKSSAKRPNIWGGTVKVSVTVTDNRWGFQTRLPMYRPQSQFLNRPILNHNQQQRRSSKPLRAAFLPKYLPLDLNKARFRILTCLWQMPHEWSDMMLGGFATRMGSY